MSRMPEGLWNDIKRGLPEVPTKERHAKPIPELLRVIEMCLDERVEYFDEAVKFAKFVYDSNPCLELKNWYSSVCYDAKKWELAYNCSVELMREAPCQGTFFNASKAAYKYCRLDEAEQYIRTAIALEPENKSQLMDLAVCIVSAGKFDEGFEILKNIPKESLDERDKVAVDFNRGWHEIRKGNFKEGMQLVHLGRKIKVWGNNEFVYPSPKWDGKTYPGKTILVVGEGGIGDEIINARFSEIIQKRGMKCVMSSVHKNTSMLSRIKTIDKVVDMKQLTDLKHPEYFKDYDYWVPCMDVVPLLGIDLDEVPSAPYITPLPEYVEKWSKIIPNNGKLRVGFRWAGNALYELELYRTVPVQKYIELTEKYDFDAYSLQRDAGVEHLPDSHKFVTLDDKLESLEDALGAIANLDLVITSCTSIAHMAAAMGKETWVMTPILPYYIWTSPGNTSEWYDTVKLYRQDKWNSWDKAFENLDPDFKNKVDTWNQN
jgi:hypothetical protein